MSTVLFREGCARRARAMCGVVLGTLALSAAGCNSEGTGPMGGGPDQTGTGGSSSARDAGTGTVREAVVRDAEYERPAPVSQIAGHLWGWKELGGATGGAWRFANSTLTVRAGGSGLGGAADAGALVSVKLRGDGEIVARVRTLQMADPLSTAGIVMRADDSTPGAPSVFLGVLAEPMRGGQVLVRRTASGAAESLLTDAQIRAFQFLRIRREGRRFTLSRSADRTGWVRVGVVELDLPAEIVAGVAVSASRAPTAPAPDAGAATTTTAEIDQLRVLQLDGAGAALGLELEPFAGNGAMATVAGAEINLTGGGDVFNTTGEGGVGLLMPGAGSQTITARVDALGGPMATRARVGLTFREGGPGRVFTNNRHALISVDAAGRLTFQKRDRLTNFDPGAVVMGMKLPLWLRLARYDDPVALRTRVQGLYSTDGVTFAVLDTVELSLADPLVMGVHFTAGDSRLHTSARLGAFGITPTTGLVASEGGVGDGGAGDARDAGAGQ